MREPKVSIDRDEGSGMYVASWDDPEGGGITTQAKSLVELQAAIREAIECHFANRKVPPQVFLHFESDSILQLS